MTYDLIKPGVHKRGFCCPKEYFRKYRSTGLIAQELSCSEQSARRWKRLAREGKLQCENRFNCQCPEDATA